MISSFDFTCDKKNYDTHKWATIDSKIVAMSLGAISNQNIVQCKECKMFGGITFDYWNSTDSYYISKNLYNDIYKRKENIPYSCNEFLIKNILE